MSPLSFEAGDRRSWTDWRRRLRESKWLILIELALVAAIFYADHLNLIVFSKTPYLLVVAWLSLFIRDVRWRDLGARIPSHWPRHLLVGVAFGLALSGLELFITQPLLVALTGEWPDLEGFRRLIGNAQLLVVAIALSWLLAAVGEELVYRSWLLTRLFNLIGDSTHLRVGIAVAVMSVIFGIAHADQGFTGIAETAVHGLLLGILFLAMGRNLLAPVVAHGVVDTIDVVLIYLGRYPGM